MGRFGRKRARGNGRGRPAPAYNPDIDPSDHVLILCTGNICRSPMAEGLLRRRLEARRVPVTVASAGLAFEDRPPTPEAVDAAAAYGVDITGHRSRVMSAPVLRDADMIIAMERFHAREAFVLDESVLARCFTLKELVRRGSSVGPRHEGEPLEAWLRRVGASRRPAELIGASDEDDIADPYRARREVYDECIAQIDHLIGQVVDLAWPAAVERREGVA